VDEVSSVDVEGWAEGERAWQKVPNARKMRIHVNPSQECRTLSEALSAR